MLSIKAITLDTDYHQYLVDDYYLDGELGGWTGQGAARLGLLGHVTREEFQALRRGFALDGRALVKNAGSKKRQVGWDLTLSMPKSLAVIWSEADPVLRRRIRLAHFRAVKFALGYLERTSAFIRLGKGGEVRERCGLVVGTFNHAASRELDPEPHTHCVVFNLGVTESGNTGAILSKPFYRQKMTAGALYRAALADIVEREFAFGIKNDGKTWDVDGVPRKLMRVYSKRRAQILEEMDREGDHSTEAASRATEKTKRKKVKVSEADLYDGWHETNREHGFTEQSIASLRRTPKDLNPYHEVALIARQAVDRLLGEQSYFTEAELLREIAIRAPGRGIFPTLLYDAVDHILGDRDLIVRVGDRRGEMRYTTPSMLQLEESFIKLLDASRRDQRHVVDPTNVDRKLKEKLPLLPEMPEDDYVRNREQREAIEHLTIRPGSIQVLSGLAGTGKTTTLRLCRELWEEAGYEVTGVALAGKAGRELERGAGIESETLALRVIQIERAAFELTKKSVVVVDEAGMVGTKQLAILAQAVKKAGAKLVVCGDKKQLQPIEAGAPFAQMGRQLGEATLSHITRQRLKDDDENPRWEREAVEHFSKGEAKEGLALFGERGHVVVGENRLEAMRTLVREWKEAGGTKSPKEHIILTGTNEDARALNRLCQRARLSSERSSETRESIKVEDEIILQGDRVLFTKKSRKLNLDNGDLGTVKRFGGQRVARYMTVSLDDGRTVHVPLNDYSDFRLGFAATTHKAQGGTYERAWVLAGGGMQDLHMSYVQASRARELTRFYMSKDDAGEEREKIARKMSEDRSKEMAHAAMEDNRKRIEAGRKVEMERAQALSETITRNAELLRELRESLEAEREREITRHLEIVLAQ